MPLKPINFQSILKCTNTTNKSPDDATKTRVNVEKDNQSISTVHKKSQSQPSVNLTRCDISNIVQTHSNANYDDNDNQSILTSLARI